MTNNYQRSDDDDDFEMSTAGRASADTVQYNVDDGTTDDEENCRKQMRRIKRAYLAKRQRKSNE